MVSGIKTFDEMLNSEVKAATRKAVMIGVMQGMEGGEAVRLLS